MNNWFSKMDASRVGQRALMLSIALSIGFAACSFTAFAQPGGTNQQTAVKKKASAPVAKLNSQAPAEAARARQSEALRRQAKLSITAKEREDIVLVMPGAKSDSEAISDALQEAHGTLIEVMGEGEMRILVVQAERGKAAELEKKLKKDRKNFAKVQRNRRFSAAQVAAPPGEPNIGQAWHLYRMHCFEAWQVMKNKVPSMGAKIMVFDTGCQASTGEWLGTKGTDVTGDFKSIGSFLRNFGYFIGEERRQREIAERESYFAQAGYTAEQNSIACTDRHGHGTHVATTAAGLLNGKVSAGVNPWASIDPVRIADGPAGEKVTTDELALISGMCVALQSKARIVNISYGPLVDPDDDEIAHAMFEYFYKKKDGLIFLSAGNDGEVYDCKNSPYVNVISAIGNYSGLHLANTLDWSSSYGTPVDFTAPGVDIVVTGIDGKMRYASGTSFSSPIVAGIASLILTVNPKLKNYQVEEILRLSCNGNGMGGYRNTHFGFGMPDAYKAVRIAAGTAPKS